MAAETAALVHGCTVQHGGEPFTTQYQKPRRTAEGTEMWKRDPISSLWASPAPAAPLCGLQDIPDGVTVERVCKSSQAENEQVGRVKDQIMHKCCSHGNRRDKAIEIKRTHIFIFIEHELCCSGFQAGKITSLDLVLGSFVERSQCPLLSNVLGASPGQRRRWQDPDPGVTKPILT